MSSCTQSGYTYIRTNKTTYLCSYVNIAKLVWSKFIDHMALNGKSLRLLFTYSIPANNANTLSGTYIVLYVCTVYVHEAVLLY